MTVDADLDGLIPVEPGEAHLDVLAETERQILGAILTMSATMDDVALEIAHWRDPMHQALYARMVDRHGRGLPVDALSMAQAITTDRTLQQHQRRALLDYLPSLVAGNGLPAGPLADGVAYVRAAAVRRLTGQLSARLHRLACDAEPDELVDQLDRARDALIAASGTAERPDAGLGASIEAYLNGDGQTVRRVPTPYADLTTLLGGGFVGGQLIVIAGRPAMGKSVVGLDVVRRAAAEEQRVLLVSLEMSQAEISARYLAAAARVPLTVVRQMREHPEAVSREDYARMAEVAGQIAQLDDLVRVIDPAAAGAYTVAALRRQLAALRRLDTPVDLAVVDYLQLLTPARRGENRQTEVAEMTRALKLLSLETGIPIVVVAQLNRQPEQRADKRPQLGDLRESGAVEQDADVVILLHREDAYDPKSPRAGEMDLIVAKHRNGPTGTVTVAFQGHYSRCVDMTR